MRGCAKASKTGKHKSSSSDDDNDICPRSWPDMPQHIINILREHISLFDRNDISLFEKIEKITYGAILKTWRVKHKRCYDMAKESACMPQLSDISYHDECRRHTEHKHYLQIQQWGIPKYNSDTFVTSLKKRRWLNHERSLFDPYSSDNKRMELVNGLWVNKNCCYALSLQGTLVVMEITGSEQRLTALGRNRAVPSAPSKYFREFLVESDGDILLVFLISKKYLKVVDVVEIFKLDHQKLLWIEMKSLGNRTMFVGSNCCLTISASKSGCRSNCIYFIHRENVDWWIYDMNSNTILTDWNESDDSSPYRIPDLPEICCRTSEVY